MVEIFKTNVTNKKLAEKVLKILHATLPAYIFNFDLEDCDRILRAQSSGAAVESSRIIREVERLSIEIIALPD